MKPRLNGHKILPCIILNNAAVGLVIKMISAEAVKKLPVPDVPLYEQQRIANELKELTNDLRERTLRYNRTVARLRNKAAHICEEWNEE